MEECVHGNDPETCPPCKPRAAQARSHPVILRTFDAKYPGRCSQCDMRFDEGDRIALLDDETYACDICSDTLKWAARHPLTFEQ